MNLRIGDGETITALEQRDVVILAARPELTVTWTRYAGGEPGPGLHVHREHTDAFYVLEGKLTFAVGPGAERVTVGPGAFVAVPPNTVHTFSNDSGGEATWLNFHAPDKGFAAYLRTGTAWDSFDAPADGGRPAGDVMVSGTGERERVVPGLRIVEWEAEPGSAPEHAGGRWTFPHARGVLEIRAPD